MFRSGHLVLYLLLYSCTIQPAAGQEGIYEYIEYGFTVSLALCKDGKFVFTEHGLGRFLGSSGTWRLNSDTLILNTFQQKGIIDVFEDICPNADSLRFAVRTEDALPAGLGTTVVNRDTAIASDSLRYGYDYSALDSSGECALGLQSIKKFRIFYLGEDLRWKVRDSRANRFVVFFHFPDRDYVYMRNERWLVRPTTVVSPIGEILTKKDCAPTK